MRISSAAFRFFSILSVVGGFSYVSLLHAKTNPDRYEQANCFYELGDAKIALDILEQKNTGSTSLSEQEILLYLKCCENGVDFPRALLKFNETRSTLSPRYLNKAIEEVSWSCLKRGFYSSNINLQFNALVGVAMTHDARGIDVLLEGLRSSQQICRQLAAHFAGEWRDPILLREIARVVKTEPDWRVRAEMAHAFSFSQDPDYLPIIEERMLKKDLSTEEISSWLLAYVNLMPKPNDLWFERTLALKHPLFDQLLCEAAFYFKRSDWLKHLTMNMNQFTNPVKAALLTCIGRNHGDGFTKVELEALITDGLKSNHSLVRFAAAYLGILCHNEEALSLVESAILKDEQYQKILAVACLKASGTAGIALSKSLFYKTLDPVIKINLGVHLLCHGELKSDLKILEECVGSKMKGHWRQVRFEGTPFNAYICDEGNSSTKQSPEEMYVSLTLFKTLASHGSVRSAEWIREYMKKNSEDFFSIAAQFLLKEGDEGSYEEIAALLYDEHGKARLEVALFLAFLGKEEKSCALLMESYRYASKQEKIAILQALSFVANRSCMDFLLEILNEPFQIHQVVASSGLLTAMRR